MDEPRTIYRIVISGLPQMDGTYKTIQLGAEYVDFDAAERALMKMALLSQYQARNDLRIQSREATPWRELE